MKKLIIAAALSLVPVIAAADTAKNEKTDKTDTTKTTKAEKLSNDDLKVVEHIHHVNQMEIELAKLAQVNGTAAVKAYAQMMVTDHTKADKDLTAFAKKHGTATIPKETMTTDADKAKDKSMTDQMAALKKVKGSEFDRQYLAMMVEGHDSTLADLKSASDTIADPELKTMVSGSVIPTVQTHADKARELQSSLPKS